MHLWLRAVQLPRDDLDQSLRESSIWSLTPISLKVFIFNTDEHRKVEKEPLFKTENFFEESTSPITTIGDDLTT